MIPTEGPSLMRSETERHWDQLSIGTATLGTAAMAAVFAVSGLAETGEETTTLASLIRMTGTAISTGLYSAMVTQAGRTIFLPRRNLTDSQRHTQKWRDAVETFALFGTLVAALAVMVFAIILIPPDAPPSRQDRSRTVTVQAETWAMLEAITGTGDSDVSDDDKLRMLLGAGTGTGDAVQSPDAAHSNLPEPGEKRPCACGEEKGPAP